MWEVIKKGLLEAWKRETGKRMPIRSTLRTAGTQYEYLWRSLRDGTEHASEVPIRSFVTADHSVYSDLYEEQYLLHLQCKSTGFHTGYEILLRF